MAGCQPLHFTSDFRCTLAEIKGINATKVIGERLVPFWYVGTRVQKLYHMDSTAVGDLETPCSGLSNSTQGSLILSEPKGGLADGHSGMQDFIYTLSNGIIDK